MKATAQPQPPEALCAPVDAARAVFRGLVLVGHRCSIALGQMFWALPGRAYADASALRSVDPSFSVVRAPSAQQLADLQHRFNAPKETPQ